MPKKKIKSLEKICLWPPLSGVGGPSSFYQKMAKGLEKEGIILAKSPVEEGNQAVLVIGGSSQLGLLWKARRQGVKIVQRLNGMNWVHRKRYTGINHFMRSERNNMLLATIRRHLTHGVVYQSNFSQDWWKSVFKAISSDECVVYNGVDLARFSPGPLDRIPNDCIRLLIIEGHMGGGHQYGLEIAHQLGIGLMQQLQKKVEINILGDVPLIDRAKWEKSQEIRMNFLGVVPGDQIVNMDQTSHLIYTTELNAACPNSVIEAMACGLPVIGYRTGAIYEILGDEGGVCVPYGSNYWNLEPPDISALVQAGVKVIKEDVFFRETARKRAERLFGEEEMVRKYLDFIRG